MQRSEAEEGFATCVEQTIRSSNTLPIVQPTLVFDGDCGFCRCSAEFLRRRVRPDCKIVAWQSADLDTLGLTPVECNAAVQWVNDGRSLSGARAIAGVLKTGTPVWRMVGSLIDLQPIRPIAGAVYRLVARNRSRLVQLCGK